MTDIEQRTLVTRLSKAIAKQVTVQSLPILGKIKSNATLKEEDVIPLIESRFIVSTSSTSTLNNFDPNLNLDDWSYLPQNYNYYQTDALNTDSSWTIITYAKYSEVSAQSTQESMAIEILDTTGAFEITYQIGVNYQGTELRMLATIRDNTGAYHWLDAPSPGFIDISSIEIGDVFSLATSYDSVANTLTCYVNGTEVISSTPQAVLADSSLNYRVRLNNYSGSFDTKLYKDTLVFDSVLTGSEIADIQTQSVFTAAVNALTAQYIANNNISSGGGANFTITYGGEGIREFVVDIANINNISGITQAEVQTMIDDAVTTRISSNNSPLQTEQQTYIYNETRPAFTGLYELKDSETTSVETSNSTPPEVKDICILEDKVYFGYIDNTAPSSGVQRTYIGTMDLDRATGTLSNLTRIIESVSNQGTYGLSVTPDGKRLATCFYYNGSVVTYDFDGTNWNQINTVVVSGYTVREMCLGGTGDMLFVLGFSGSIKEFRLNEYASWVEEVPTTIPSFGNNRYATTSLDGKLIIGANSNTNIREYRRTTINDDWVATDFVVTGSGGALVVANITSFSVSIDGGKLLGATAGGVKIFVKQIDNSWMYVETITPATANTKFGVTVSTDITSEFIATRGTQVLYPDNARHIELYEVIPTTAPIIAPNQDISFLEGNYTEIAGAVIVNSSSTLSDIRSNINYLVDNIVDANFVNDGTGVYWNPPQTGSWSVESFDVAVPNGATAFDISFSSLLSASNLAQGTMKILDITNATILLRYLDQYSTTQQDLEVNGVSVDVGAVSNRVERVQLDGATSIRIEMARYSSLEYNYRILHSLVFI